MKKQQRRKGNSFFAYFIFFLLIATTVTVAMFIFGFVNERSEGDMRIVSLVMMLVILFLSLICTVIDAARRRITVERPLRKILNATDKIASGDFSVRLRVAHSYHRYDEFDYIMENLNRTAAELSKTEMLRNDFISNVSHELKTPLTVIQSYAASLQKENIPEDTRKKYAATLQEAAKRLNDLVVNILRLNKLENQAIQPEREEIKLDEELAQTVLRYEELIDAKKLILDCRLDEVTIYSSPSLLELVWNNLLSNAVKFTEEGGAISVTLQKQSGKAVVKVSDTGCGISKATGEHIFEKFYQGDTSHAREGNGLGLALVKKVIDLIGGEIRVESELGKGTTFTVLLQEDLA
ncbi:MAG: sensor histidine kinase [Clostridia bacterium]|nr:sensor histidine kinase [Clostridia bacterium]